MTLGSRLKQLRTSQGLGMKELARKVVVNHAYLSRIESDRLRPSEQALRKLAEALEHDEAELMMLADRIPREWRSTIQESPEKTALLIRESLGEYSRQQHTPSDDSVAFELTRQPARSPKARRKSPSGVSTNQLVFSTHCGTNDELFPDILSLYVAPGSVVADVTYGKGVFWKNVPQDLYHLKATDLSQGVDCRSLPYETETIDCVVLDPPYMHTPGGTAHVGHQNYEGYYRNNANREGALRKYHEAVLDLYFNAGDEAYRVLKGNGVFIVKCADEVCANQQRLTHVELINEFGRKGFLVEDLFILVRNNRPGVSRILRQVHARKNHSYFLVFRKSNGKSRWPGPVVSTAQQPNPRPRRRTSQMARLPWADSP
jgi:transcriptional regulator with XRE-family HTH domain